MFLFLLEEETFFDESEHQMKFVQASAVPQTWEGNTFYMITDGVGGMAIYVTNDDGSEVRHTPLVSELGGKAVVFAETAPDPLTTPEGMWWDTTNGVLFIKYDDGSTVAWVEASPSPSVPDVPAFAGNGVADTMSRSDHWHESVTINDPSW